MFPSVLCPKKFKTQRRNHVMNIVTSSFKKAPFLKRFSVYTKMPKPPFPNFSGLKNIFCKALFSWTHYLNLPGNKVPAGIALKVTEPRPRGKYSCEFWIGVCREKQNLIPFLRPKPKKMTPYSREKKKIVINSMKRKTLFIFCNIGCINDSHINNVAFSHSSSVDNTI